MLQHQALKLFNIFILDMDHVCVIPVAEDFNFLSLDKRRLLVVIFMRFNKFVHQERE